MSNFTESYKRAGVDVTAGYEAVRLMKDSVARTTTLAVIGGLVMPVSLFGLSFDLPQQGFALLSLVFIWLYNGRQGPHGKAVKYSFYVFYPLHMLILGLIAIA